MKQHHAMIGALLCAALLAPAPAQAQGRTASSTPSVALALACDWQLNGPGYALRARNNTSFTLPVGSRVEWSYDGLALTGAPTGTQVLTQTLAPNAILPLNFSTPVSISGGVQSPSATVTPGQGGWTGGGTTLGSNPGGPTATSSPPSGLCRIVARQAQQGRQ